MAATRGFCVLKTALILIVFGLPAIPAHAKYGGGTGDPNDPYLIYTAEQMNAIGTNPGDWDKHFRLMADIDLASLGGVPFNIIGTAQEVHTRGTLAASDDRSIRAADDANPIGPFRGVFDGDDHTIFNFVYTSPVRGDVGLFGTVADPNAEIRNVRLIAPRIDIYTGENTGSLVGYLRQGNLINCHAENTDVHGRWGNVGGLVGRSGFMQPGDEAYVTIRDCSCTGHVSAEFSIAGGLVGDSSFGLFDRCFAACEVTGKDKVGGLVGTAGFPGSSMFINCYFVGDVTGDERVGGLLGYGGMFAITNCYSVARITGRRYAGGFVGAPTDIEMRVTASFWHAEIFDSQDQVTILTGKTTAEMRDPNMFMAAGWNFVGKSDGPGDVWAEPAGGGYPILWWQLPEPPKLAFSGGTGTAGDPYLIATAEQLNSIGHNPRLMGAHLKVIDDIDLSGVHFYPIGNNEYAFEGVFDGGNFTISNLTCVGVESQDIGLFGIVTGDAAEVRNVRLVDPMVGGAKTKNVGSLAGRMWRGTLRNCHVEGGRVSGRAIVGGLVGQNGTPFNGAGVILARLVNCSSNTIVAGQTAIGGLVGMNGYSAMLSDCHADGDASGQLEVGGLAGINSGACKDCYATGSVSADGRVGGLVGRASSSDNTIVNCYSAGRVLGKTDCGGLVGRNDLGTVTACFWDIQTSGQQSSAGGIGRTTSEMKVAATFLDAGWDFVDETRNGTEDMWSILEGQDYPRLSWERDKQP